MFFCAGCERDKVAFERRLIPESSWPLQEQFPLLLALMGSEVPEGEKFHSTLSKQADQSVCRLCSTLFFFFFEFLPASAETTKTETPTVSLSRMCPLLPVQRLSCGASFQHSRPVQNTTHSLCSTNSFTSCCSFSANLMRWKGYNQNACQCMAPSQNVFSRMPCLSVLAASSFFFSFHFTIFRRLKSCKVQSFNQKPEKRYKSTMLCVGQLVNKRTRLNPVVCAYHAPLPPLVGAVEW